MAKFQSMRESAPESDSMPRVTNEWRNSSPRHGLNNQMMKPVNNPFVKHNESESNLRIDESSSFINKPRLMEMIDG